MMGRSTNASSRDRRCDRKDIVGPVQGGYDCVVVSISMLLDMYGVICGSCPDLRIPSFPFDDE